VSHEDNWYSIERPLALPEPQVVIEPIPGIPGVIPVTGGQLVQLTCETECVMLTLPDGSYAEFCGLCDYWASVVEEYEETIPYDMPADAELKMGSTVVLMDPDQNILDALPTGTTLQVGFPMAESDDVDSHKMHEYDTALGEWVELTAEFDGGVMSAYETWPGTTILHK